MFEHEVNKIRIASVYFRWHNHIETKQRIHFNFRLIMNRKSTKMKELLRPVKWYVLKATHIVAD